MKKLLISLLLAILCIISLTGCNSVPEDNGIKKYNAVMYSHAEGWLKQEYMEKNRLRRGNIMYFSGEDDLDPTEVKYVEVDDNYPDERTIIISSQEEFNKAFRKCNYTVDFEKEIVILYIFSDCNTRDYYLKKVTLEDKTLNIEYIIEEAPPLSIGSVEPYHRCFMVKINKIEFDTVNFIKQR